MPSTPYEALGRAVWKGGKWYLRRRYMPTAKGGRLRTAAKRVGVGVLFAVALGGAIAVAQRRGDHAA